MDLITVRSWLQGVLVYAVTPFSHDNPDVLDEGGLRRNVQFLITRRVKGVVPCGGTGEFWSLRLDEYKRVVETVRDAAGDTAIVMPGAGGSLDQAVAQVEYAEAVGCGAVMVFTPPGRISESGLVAYFRAVANRTGLGVVPYLTSPLSLTSLETLSDVANVVAIKDATGDLGWFRKAIRAVGSRVNWLCEGESLAPYYLLHGAVGLTSGVANFAPDLSLELSGAAQRGDFRRAGELQRFLDPWAELRGKPGNHVPVVKLAMDRLKLAGGSVRLPLLPLSEGDVREVDRLLADLLAASGTRAPL